MKISDKVLPLFRERLTPSEEALDGLPDDELELADPLANQITQTLDDINYLTDDHPYGNKLLNLISQNKGNQIFGASIIKNIENIVCALMTANSAESSTWEKEHISTYERFKLSELNNLDEIMDNQGDRIRVYCHDNKISVKDSFAFIDLRGIETLEEIIEKTKIDSDSTKHPLILILCEKILQHDKSISGKFLLLSTTIEKKVKKSMVIYTLISNQKTITKRHDHSNRPPIDDIIPKIKISSDYRQYAETIAMLSEINYRSTIIDIFMSTYHVLENYMLRAKVAELSDQTNDKDFFSIRDFKRLEISLDEKEHIHLNDLFKSCRKINIGDVNFEKFIEDKKSDLVSSTSFDEDEFNKMMLRLNVTKKNGTNIINSGQFIDQYVSKIIYKIRCSIVHNKETEFHISNRELSIPIYKLVITEFALPIMQRLAYGLPTVSKDNPIDYKHRTIELYRN